MQSNWNVGSQSPIAARISDDHWRIALNRALNKGRGE